MMRYRYGELAAFDQLYRRHKDPLYRFLLRGCGQPDIAGELFQDVWARLIDSRGRYQVSAKFTTWLYTLAHNRLVDHLRRQRPQLSLEDAEAAAAPQLHAAPERRPDAQAEAAERAGQLRAALAALPDDQRATFLLHEEGGLTLEQIASVSGVGRETIKSRLRYALAKLRRTLADV